MKAHEVGLRIEAAAARVRVSEEELDTFLAAALASVFGAERYRGEVERRQEEVRAAQRELSEALRANLFLGQAGSRTPEQLLADGPGLTMDEKRAVVRAYVERVVVAKADPKRRRWQPVGERGEIRWVGVQG